jgi:ABC-type dipeptide/oligopeptide/nickel transport system permease subunit
LRSAALLAFCESLQDTELSQAIQNNSDLIAFLQSLHILAISVILIAMLVFNFRLIGNKLSDSLYLNGFKYNAIISLPVLLITGTFLIIAEPARSLANDAFQLKMILLLLVLGIYRYLNHTAFSTTDFPNTSVEISLGTKLLAASSILMWAGIVFAGRWIAYL